MARARILGIASIILLASTLLLGVRVFQLNGRLDRAEVYVRSGSTSVFMICSAVVVVLRLEYDVDGVLIVAKQCLGSLTLQEADTVSREFATKNRPAIIARIEARLARRALPYQATEGVLFPEGYP